MIDLFSLFAVFPLNETSLVAGDTQQHLHLSVIHWIMQSVWFPAVKYDKRFWLLDHYISLKTQHGWEEHKVHSLPLVHFISEENVLFAQPHLSHWLFKLRYWIYKWLNEPFHSFSYEKAASTWVCGFYLDHFIHYNSHNKSKWDQELYCFFCIFYFSYLK